MTIFITGDTHGDNSVIKLAPGNFDGSGLTRDDYVIVLGDFGFPWVVGEDAQDRWWLDWYQARPWTTLFIDGNHENFDALATYPTEEWRGGLVHRIRENVLHLRRAQVFEIGGCAFFTMGGGKSVDKEQRHIGLTWWPEEIPGAATRRRAERKIAEVGGVDYVLTHCPPTNELYNLSYEVDFPAHADEYNNWLQTAVADKLQFKQWFYGHMHVDRWHRRPCTPLFDVIFALDGTGKTPSTPTSANCDSFLDTLSQLSCKL